MWEFTAVRKPSKLRYVDCELPDEVEQAIIAFEDDFELRLQPYYERLDDFVSNELPIIQKELQEQVALREELVKGAPVESLSSLLAIEESTNLTSPTRDVDRQLGDPVAEDTRRIDERKIGSSGICLLNGRMFRILANHRRTALPSSTTDPITTSTGIRNRLVALRHLWESSGGDYDAFVRLGIAIYSNAEGSYTLLESSMFDNELMPYMNRGFTYLSEIGLKTSQFRHRMIWTNNVGITYNLRASMASQGYTSEQINNIFSGQDPNIDFNFTEALTSVQELIANVTRLIFLPKEDPVRQPPWDNETNYLELALRRFLLYRLHKYTTSSIFDREYWTAFITELRPRDVKELLEHRHEVLDIELPQDVYSLTNLVEQAIALPGETPAINTYMNNLPISAESERRLTESLYDLGLSIYRKLEGIGNHTRAAQVKDLLLELVGMQYLRDFYSPNIMINPAEVSALFPTTNLPPVGMLIAAVEAQEQVDEGDNLTRNALAANSASGRFLDETNRSDATPSEDSRPSDQTPQESFGTTGVVQGLSVVETIAMLLNRCVDWSVNFTDCSGGAAVGQATSPSSQGMEEVASYSRKEVHDFDAGQPWDKRWQEHKNNMSYIEERVGKRVKSVSEIRQAVQESLTEAESAGSVNRRDTNINNKLRRVNSQNDIKKVAEAAVELLKALPGRRPRPAATTPPGSQRAWETYSAKNRNIIQRQEGKKQPPGVTTQDAKSFGEAFLGTRLPFVGGSDKMLVPFSANVSLDLQICQNGFLKQFDDFLKRMLTLPGWLIRLINLIKHQIQTFQDKIDAFILKIQAVMDLIFSTLERLLTLDFNFSGNLGFENSLFKCSWGLDLGLKIDLFGLLMLYFDKYLSVVLDPVLTFLSLLGDLVNEIFCIPIRWIGEVLNGALFVLAKLLAIIGCTIKDFKLPTEIFELLGLINATFSLRSLVFKKGSADWLNMMGRFKKGKNEFRGLSQFANVCANPNLAGAVSALFAAVGLAVSDLPVSAAKKGIDPVGIAMSTIL